MLSSEQTGKDVSNHGNPHIAYFRKSPVLLTRHMCLIKERIHELYENQQLINNLNIVSSNSTASKDSRCQASTTQIHCCKAPNFAIYEDEDAWSHSNQKAELIEHPPRISRVAANGGQKILDHLITLYTM